MKKLALVISCEHAVDTVPEQYQSLFIPFQALLASHRGIDFGALAIAQHFKQKIPSDLILATCTRLLVDCNKSAHHPRCFSKVTRDLPDEEKQKIMDQYYWPYRQQVIAQIKRQIDAGFQVLHLSIHSFTPALYGEVRNADIGLLYDPRRSAEKILARQWKMEIKKLAPTYKTRMNYPYKGISDGFTREIRKQYTDEQYIGIEVETNQALTLNAQMLDSVKNILTVSLLNLIC